MIVIDIVFLQDSTAAGSVNCQFITAHIGLEIPAGDLCGQASKQALRVTLYVINTALIEFFIGTINTKVQKRYTLQGIGIGPTKHILLAFVASTGCNNAIFNCFIGKVRLTHIDIHHPSFCDAPAGESSDGI